MSDELNMNLAVTVNLETEYNMTLPEGIGILKYDGEQIILLLNKKVDVLVCDEK